MHVLIMWNYFLNAQTNMKMESKTRCFKAGSALLLQKVNKISDVKDV